MEGGVGCVLCLTQMALHASISQFHNMMIPIIILLLTKTVSLQPSYCGFFEWIDEVKRSPTPTPEDDEEYKNREYNYEAERQACPRHRGEDLIWCTSMQRQEYNINQCKRQLDIREAHLRVRERICDCREAKICAARMTISTFLITH
jgi:hypothetical protein